MHTQFNKLSYDKRLHSLGLPQLEQCWEYLDLVFTNKLLTGQLDISMSPVGLQLSGNENRSLHGCNLKSMHTANCKVAITFVFKYQNWGSVLMKMKTLINGIFLNKVKVYFNILCFYLSDIVLLLAVRCFKFVFFLYSDVAILLACISY